MGLKEILFGALLTISSALGVGIGGFFIDTPDCSLKVYRRPTGPIDTLRTKTNFAGKWVIETANFNPPAGTGETLYIYGGWNLGRKAKTFLIRGPPEYNSLDLNLDKFTACIKNVYDSSHVSAPLKAIYSLQGVAPETTEVDTGYNQGFAFYYDIHVPFDTLQATQGKQGIIRLEKTLADTTWYRVIPFTVDRTRFDAQLVKDTVYFTKDSMIIGVEESKLENLVRDKGKLIVSPNITRGDIILNQEGDYYIYNVLGREVLKGKYQKGNQIDLDDLPAGAYMLFVKPKDSKELLKPEKVIYLK